MLNSKNQNSKFKDENQSAGNLLLKRSSETLRVLSEKEKEWLAGIIDGDGSFDIRKINNKRVLRCICITQSLRDIRILYKVKDLLKEGSIKPLNSNILRYRISTNEGMRRLINYINGNIRIKLPGFLNSCSFFNISFKKASIKIPSGSSYLAGLIDTHGSIVFNYPNNCIQVHLEFKQNIYTEVLDFSDVIENIIPKIYKYKKRNQSFNKIFYSIRFSYSNKGHMLPLYEYFRKNRLFSDFKFFRVMQIKKFLLLRSYKNYPKESYEFKMYQKFLKNFFIHLNNNKPLPYYLLS